MEMFKDCIAKNGGSDIVSSDEDLEDPGQRELFDNLNTVNDRWYEVPIEEVKFIIPSGKPPSNIPPKQWKEIEERSTAFGKVVEKKLPIIWLLLEMRKLKIDEDFLHNKILQFEKEVEKSEQKISASDIFAATTWVDAVMKYNGYAKILKELHKFAKDVDGQPLPFCYDFYQQKEMGLEDISSTFSKYNPFDESEVKSEDGEGDEGDGDDQGFDQDDDQGEDQGEDQEDEEKYSDDEEEKIPPGSEGKDDSEKKTVCPADDDDWPDDDWVGDVAPEHEQAFDGGEDAEEFSYNSDDD